MRKAISLPRIQCEQTVWRNLTTKFYMRSRILFYLRELRSFFTLMLVKNSIKMDMSSIISARNSHRNNKPKNICTANDNETISRQKDSQPTCRHARAEGMATTRRRDNLLTSATSELPHTQIPMSMAKTCVREWCREMRLGPDKGDTGIHLYIECSRHNATNANLSQKCSFQKQRS